MKSSQRKLFENSNSLQYGGNLRNKKKNRGARPLSTKESMHLVLRSSVAKGEWSFLSPRNADRIIKFINEFSFKRGVEIKSFANVGNHLHIQIKIPNRTVYKAWIRGLTSGIAMLVMKLEGLRSLKAKKIKFWDYRPFTRVIRSFQGFKNIKDYIKINQLEGLGYNRMNAEVQVKVIAKKFQSMTEGLAKARQWKKQRLVQDSSAQLDLLMRIRSGAWLGGDALLQQF